MLELANGFQERLTFDITYSAAYFNDSNSRIFIRKVTIEAALDLVGDVRNDLYGASTIVAAAFLLQNRPVDLSCGDVGILIQIFINETLIMSQIKLGFRSVLGDKNLAVLDRVHGAGVDIDIRVKLLHGDLVAPGFQQST